jgi:hypothetical protein
LRPKAYKFIFFAMPIFYSGLENLFPNLFWCRNLFPNFLPCPFNFFVAHKTIAKRRTEVKTKNK